MMASRIPHAAVRRGAMREKAKRTFQVPHTYTIIFILMIIVAVMTWVVPSGTLPRRSEIDGREVTVAVPTSRWTRRSSMARRASRSICARVPERCWEAPIASIMAAAEVVAFVFIVGGAFQIITATGAIDAGMRRVVRRFKSKDILVIPIAMLLFALGGSTFGMAEEDPAVLRHIPAHHDRHGLRFATAFMIVFIGAKGQATSPRRNPSACSYAQGVIGITGNPAAVAARHHVRGDRGSVHRVGGAPCPQGAQESPSCRSPSHDDKQKRLDMGAVDDFVPLRPPRRSGFVVFLAGMALIVSCPRAGT